MIRRLLNLGQSTLVRRLIAALILLGAAVLRTLWDDQKGAEFWISLVSGLILAAIALTFLRFRWRKNERREITPTRIGETFS